MIEEIGEKGQEKLKGSSVLVVGAGGLGCPVLQYLAAAGVGRIGIVEYDMVEESNLQRQILYGSLDRGKLKSIISRDRLNIQNDLVDIELFNIRLAEKNVDSLIEGFDVIVDATDNYETRYIISDASQRAGKPMVHGAIYKFEGQVSVFNYRGGPTYRCYNPDLGGAPKANPAPSAVGLFGVLPGITGTLMANEVIKIITNMEEVLSGKVLIFNTIKNTSYTINVIPDPYNQNIKQIKHDK